ncbi:MAG: sortase, partial [Gammaproteobacteria bacterium]
MRRGRTLLLLALIGAGLCFGGHAGYIYAKAVVAQALIQRAWRDSLETRHQVKPWSWADTWPVARLVVPSLDVDLCVLAGDYGSSLAFGPGRRLGTNMISGHRDTHFRFLKRLRTGQVILLQERSGSWHRYRVIASSVVNKSVNLPRIG